MGGDDEDDDEDDLDEGEPVLGLAWEISVGRLKWTREEMTYHTPGRVSAASRKWAR